MGVYKLIAIASALILNGVPSMKLFAGTSISGEWDHVVVTDQRCDHVFELTQYESEHFLVGPHGLTSVFHFTDTDLGGFWDGLNLVTNWGANHDFLADEFIVYGDENYHLVVYGLVDSEIALLEAEVKLLDQADGEVCQATAEYFGRIQ